MARSPEYEAYLRSSVWQAKRQLALTAAGHRCQLCNAAQRLDVHHRTYERFGGGELPGDLTVLCRPCHDHFHARPKPGRKKQGQRPKKRKPKSAKGPARQQSKKLGQIAAENERLRQLQADNKLKQKLVREGTVSISLRADLAHRHRQ